MDWRCGWIRFLVELQASYLWVTMRFHDDLLFASGDFVDDYMLATDEEECRWIHEMRVLCNHMLKASMRCFDREHGTVHEFRASFRPHRFLCDDLPINLERTILWVLELRMRCGTRVSAHSASHNAEAEAVPFLSMKEVVNEWKTSFSQCTVEM